MGRIPHARRSGTSWWIRRSVKSTDEQQALGPRLFYCRGQFLVSGADASGNSHDSFLQYDTVLTGCGDYTRKKQSRPVAFGKSQHQPEEHLVLGGNQLRPLEKATLL